MTVQEQVYLDGFVQKCAERGVDPEELVKKGFLVGATRYRGGNKERQRRWDPAGVGYRKVFSDPGFRIPIITIAKERQRRWDPAGVGYRKVFSYPGFRMPEPERLLAYNPR